ncbi:MAG: dienelactone hydrolase, partial [Alphaproteobacteria bacterium]
GATAYEALTAEANKLGLIDAGKMGAIGFCMGGGFALEQVRAGADFKGTVVFHVTAPNPVDPDTKLNIKGRVLALHGSADPVTPKPMMDALEAEMTGAEVDWQVMMFGHAMHSFCVKGANNPPVQVYDEKLCKQSYRMMRDFFEQTL